MGAYLSSPKVDKESYDGGDLRVDPSRYGLSCMQGWRKNMEDSHICYNNLNIQEIGESISVYGVFDGHGGPNVSRWISFHFLPIFLRCLNIASNQLAQKKIDKTGEYYKLQLIKLSLEETFLKLDEEMRLRENQEKLKKYSAPQQKEEEESENSDSYIYSILNDIVSKNISIKTIEKDGKRCLQVVYNTDDQASEEERDHAVSGQEEKAITDADKEDANRSNIALESETYQGREGPLEPGKVGDVSICDTKEEKRTFKKDDATLDCTREEMFPSTDVEIDKDLKKFEEENKFKKELQVQGGGNKNINNIEEAFSSDDANNTSERTKENNTNVANTDADEAEANNKETVAEKLKQDAIAEKEIKKEEQFASCVYENENKRNGPNGKEVETYNYPAVDNSANVTDDGAVVTSAEVKSNLTYDHLKNREQQELKKENDTILNESVVDQMSDQPVENTDISENLNEEDISLPAEHRELFTEKTEDEKQMLIDEALASEDFRPFLEEFDEGEEDPGDMLEDHDSGENIANSCGSTAIVAVILKGYLLVANAGDSRAIVCFNGNSLGMSTDHKPHLEEEEMRIKRAGGYITNGRVDGNLNLTRAIGDLHYKNDPFLSQKDQKISAFPDIKCVTLTPEDEFLFLACDGIWDCKEGDEIVSFVKSRLNKFVEKRDEENDKTTESVGASEDKKNAVLNDEKESSEAKEQSMDKEQTGETLLGEQNVQAGEKEDETEITTLQRNALDGKLESQRGTNKYEKFEKLSQICEELCDDCLSTNCKDSDGVGCDNMTCLIVQYNPIYKSQKEKKFLDLDEMLTVEKSS